MAEHKQSPDLRGKVQEEMAPKVGLYRDVLGGTSSMREAGETYLPRWEMEGVKGYKKRLNSAVFYNATELTLDALVGLVFRTEPELHEELPQEILDDAENIDLTGRHINVFAKDVFSDAWDGLACILVDMQRTDGVRTRAQEDAAGLRPYWIPIKAQDIIRARPVTVSGRETLGRFSFSEEVTLEDGEFGEKTERRIRDYRLEGLDEGAPFVTYRVYARRKDDQQREAWTIIEGPDTLRVSAGEPWDEIPVSVVYTGRKAFFHATPPLLDLAYENIDHYQQRSEHRKGWQYARVPVAVFPGMDPDEVVVAADRGVTTPTAESKPYWWEVEGKGLKGSKEELLESERRMSNLGAQMLFRRENTNETATARRIESAQSNSRLASAARALQDGLEEAVRLHAKWRRAELPERTEGRWVTVTQDFDAYEMDAQTIAALDKAVANGRITNRSFLIALRDGVPVLSFIDPEKEDEQVAEESANELMAMRELMRGGESEPEVEEAA